MLYFPGNSDASSCVKVASVNANSSTELQSGPPLAVSRKPSWLRINDAVRLYGIGRSSLYELLAQNLIKSASITKRGNIRGIRLVSADSLENYLESIATGGQKEQAA